MKTLKILFALLIFTSVFSCGNQKQIIQSKTDHFVKDSVVYIDRIIVDTIKIPSETLVVKVPIEILKRDTVIEFQKGRVSTKLVYRNGSIEVSSKCDSLEKLVLRQEKQLKEYHNESTSESIVQSLPAKSEHKVPWYYLASLWGWIITATYFVGKKVFRFYFKKQ